MHNQKNLQAQLFFSLKETVSLATKAFAKSVGTLFYSKKRTEKLDSNQISLDLEKWEKDLIQSRL